MYVLARHFLSYKTIMQFFICYCLQRFYLNIDLISSILMLVQNVMFKHIIFFAYKLEIN